MQVIRALMVDDDQGNMDQFARRLDMKFEKFGWQVNWQTTVDPEEGQQLLRTSEPPYDFVLFDLLFRRKDLPDRSEPRGLELIAEAKERSARTYILAVSTGDENLADLFDLARHNGAHHVFRRYEFTQMSRYNSPAACVSAIRTHLLNNGTVCTINVMADADDPSIQSIVHEVGPPALSQLYSKILEREGSEAAAMHVNFLAPGASGAVVCTVTGESEGGAMLRHVLKVSRDEQGLLREAQQGAQAAKVLPPLLLVRQPSERPVGPVNGWYALGSPLPERAITLRSWLVQGPPQQEVEDVLVKLFVEGLGTVHAENRRCDTPAQQTLRFTHLRQRRMLQALDELTPALVREDGGRITDVRALTTELGAFLREGQLLGVPMSRLSPLTYTTFTHGDLHGGNVLICQGLHPTPVLIDPSDFDRAHWATDPARFAVDLLMRSVDAGAESMFFTRFGTWRALARSLGDRDSAMTVDPGERGTGAALAALTWLGANLHTFCPDAGGHERDEPAPHRWEWHTTLANYFLRASCHADVAPPKRALSLVAAHDQLAMATELLTR